MTRASTCSTTRASMVLNGPSTCSNTCASTCITTRASTCITTRASTCHYTRARLLFKNMHPGGGVSEVDFLLFSSSSSEPFPNSQQPTRCTFALLQYSSLVLVDQGEAALNYMWGRRRWLYVTLNSPWNWLSNWYCLTAERQCGRTKDLLADWHLWSPHWPPCWGPGGDDKPWW